MKLDDIELTEEAKAFLDGVIKGRLDLCNLEKRTFNNSDYIAIFKAGMLYNHLYLKVNNIIDQEN